MAVWTGFRLESSLFFVILLTAAAFWQCSYATINRKIGVQFLSYENTGGRLADGTCCDGLSGAGGGCAPDSCDTVFVLCFRHHSNGSNCDPEFDTPAIVNNNSITSFGKTFGGPYGNETRSLLVLPFENMEDILLEIDVVENDNGSSSRQHLMGNFSLVLNYTNPYNSHPDWDTYNFNKNGLRLSLNVTAFCSKNFYGPKCEISCRPLDNAHLGHFECDVNGTKVCLTGWQGPDCLQMIDYCVSSPCQNGGTCNKILNAFTCHCDPGFTGQLCETVVPTTTTPASTNQPASTKPTTANPSTATTPHSNHPRTWSVPPSTNTTTKHGSPVSANTPPFQPRITTPQSPKTTKKTIPCIGNPLSTTSAPSKPLIMTTTSSWITRRQLIQRVFRSGNRVSDASASSKLPSTWSITPQTTTTVTTIHSTMSTPVSATSAPSSPPITTSASPTTASATTKIPSAASSTTATTTTAIPTTRKSVSGISPTPAPFSSSSDDGSGTNAGVIIGPLVGVLLVGSAITAAYVLWQRKKKRTNVEPEDEKDKKENPEVLERDTEAQIPPTAQEVPAPAPVQSQEPPPMPAGLLGW